MSQPDMPHYDHPDVCGEADSFEDEEQNLERETPTPQGKQSADSDATPSFREIGGVEFWAVRVMKPSRHWKYRVGSQVGNQGFSTRPQMWADLEHAYSLRPDRWTKDWQNFAPKSTTGQADTDATQPNPLTSDDIDQFYLERETPLPQEQELDEDRPIWIGEPANQ